MGLNEKGVPRLRLVEPTTRIESRAYGGNEMSQAQAELRAGRSAGGAGHLPTFCVELFGEPQPQHLDGGLSQLVEQQIEACCVDSGHADAASPILSVAS
jgi:hypothetical protein